MPPSATRALKGIRIQLFVKPCLTPSLRSEEWSRICQIMSICPVEHGTWKKQENSIYSNKYPKMEKKTIVLM